MTLLDAVPAPGAPLPTAQIPTVQRPAASEHGLHLSGPFLARLRDALNGAGVACGPLAEGDPHLNLNAAFTGPDGAGVFVKVSRGAVATPGFAHEPAAADWADLHGIRVGVPLLDEPLTVRDDTGQPRQVTVWGHIEHTPPVRPAHAAAAVLNLAAQIAATPPPPQARPFDFTFYLQRMYLRLSGRHDRLSTDLVEAAEHSVAAATGILATAPARTEWLHGDLHLGNVLFDDQGRPTIIDWESTSTGPAEMDAAQIFRTAAPASDWEAQDLRRTADTVYPAILGRVLNWDLVDLLVRFRSASSASHLLLHLDEPGASERLAADLNRLGLSR